MFVFNAFLTLVQYPGLEPVLDDLLPKKVPLIVTKWSVDLLFLVLSQITLFLTCSSIRSLPAVKTILIWWW